MNTNTQTTNTPESTNKLNAVIIKTLRNTYVRTYIYIIYIEQEKESVAYCIDEILSSIRRLEGRRREKKSIDLSMQIVFGP